MSDEPIIAKGELLGNWLAGKDANTMVGFRVTPTRTPEMGLSADHKKLLIRTADHLLRVYHVTDEVIIAREFLERVGVNEESMSFALERWLPIIRQALDSRDSA